MTFRVVIATHRRPRWLGELLAALVPQITGRPGRELVVVNDGSHDAAYQEAVAPFAGAIDYRVLPAPRGPGQARQHGAEGATAEYLVFTDDDCIPPDHWLDWAEAMAETYPTVDMFGGISRPYRGKTAGILDRINEPFVPCPGPIFVDGECICLATLNMMVRRAAFTAVGGFDPEYATACEDWNLTRRLLWAGYALHADASWYVRHRVEQTIGQTWRRWRGYGRGVAQQAIHDQDWGALSLKRGQGAPRRPDGDRLAWWAYPAMNLFRRAAQEIGWHAAVRDYSRRYGMGLPEEPSVVDWCAPVALGGRPTASSGDQVETAAGHLLDRVVG